MRVFELLELLPNNVRVGLQNMFEFVRDPDNASVYTLRAYDEEDDSFISDFANDLDKFELYLDQKIVKILVPDQDVIVIQIAAIM